MSPRCSASRPIVRVGAAILRTSLDELPREEGGDAAREERARGGARVVELGGEGLRLAREAEGAPGCG